MNYPTRSHLKNRILVQGLPLRKAGQERGAEVQPAPPFSGSSTRILKYSEELKRGPNTEIRPKGFFEMASLKAICYHRNYIWAFIFIPLFFSACGYRFAGSGKLPGGIQTVAIEVLENRTPEIGLENIITNDLIYEFTRKGRSVQKKSEQPDAVLSGVIESERITTISRQAQQSALARRVEITVKLKLTGSDGGVKWSTSGVSVFEEYAVSTDRGVTETNKRRAIETLSKKLAEKVHNRLTDNF